MTMALLSPGLVVANHGRHFWVESGDGTRRICHSRGKKSLAVVGDRVLWQASGHEGTIEQVEARRNLFYRQDALRTKSFAANLDQILILIAADPMFSNSQLSRALIAAEAAGIRAVIALNKADLAEPYAQAWAWLQPYRQMGYSVHSLSLRQAGRPERTTLMQLVGGRTTLIIGPSGAGKSTLVNLLEPGALAQTGEVSRALNAGKHTTTRTTWYWIDNGRTTAVIDSPGFQEFGLHHIESARLASYMPDLKVHAQACKFSNCSHLHEPGCGVMSALQLGAEPGGISRFRYAIYSELFAELRRQGQR